MHSISRVVVALLVLASLAPTVAAAPPTDVAELYPPDTLAYAELHSPAGVSPQLAVLVKGSTLEDSISFLHKKRETTKDARDLQGKKELAILGLLTSPEMLAEFKKLGGVAVGLMGYTKAGEPEIALAILTGDSAATGLAARAFLTMDSAVRKVASVGDVPIYQIRQPSFNYDPNGRPQLANETPPTEGPHEPTYAYLPGLVLIGSSRTAITPIIQRYQGKAQGSLLVSPLFLEAAKIHRQPGLFFFANVPALATKSDEAIKFRGGTGEPDLYGWFKLVANVKAVRTLAGCARVRDGGLAVTLSATFDAAQRSPLLDFLSGSGVKVELLHAAARPVVFAAAVNFPEKDRSTVVIGFLDALAKASGGLGRLPSEAVKELEEKYKLSITNDLLAKTKSVTIVMPEKQDLPQGATALPVLVLQTESPEVAAAWEAFLPKLIADLSSSPPTQPAAESISGVKVLSLPGAGLPWKAAVHSARQDSRIAIGLDRKWVALAASSNPANSIVAGDKALIIPPGEPPVLLGALGLGGFIRELNTSKKLEGPVVPVQPARPDGGEITLPNKADLADEMKAWEGFLKSFDTLPPATLTARRAGNELRFELWQPRAVDGGLVSVINAAVGWFDIVLNRSAENPGGGPGRYPRFR